MSFVQRNRLKNVSVAAISIVRKGANNKSMFLFKSGEEGHQLATGSRVIKADDDWNAFYAVVAEPDWEEKPGAIADQNAVDVWDSEDEIRKTAHGFLKSGGLINKMHETLDPYGELVESAVALSDFSVNGETIKKGSWYIAVEPTPEGKQLIKQGEFTGISIEGHGDRIVVEKSGDPFDDLDVEFLSVGGELIAKGPLERVPGVQNWVDQVGGLPDLISRAAVHIHGTGRPISQSIATAVNWAKKMCASGTAFGGKVRVSAGAQARACAAVAEWEAKKAQARVTKSDAAGEETPEVVQEYLTKSATLSSVDDRTTLQKIRDFLNGEDLESNNGDSATLEDEMDEAKLNERFEKIEGDVAAIGTKVDESQTALLAKLDELKPAPADDKDDKDDKSDEPTLSAVNERLEEIAKSVSDLGDLNDQLEKLSGDVDALAEGQKSEDGDDTKQTVRKSDNPLAGLLS